MKKLSALLCFLLLLCACGRADATADVPLSVMTTIPQTQTLPVNRRVRVGLTQTLADTGLAELLQSAFEAQSDYRLDFAVNPDVTALAAAQSGNADVLLVQQGMTADRFVSAGYGVQCLPWLRVSLILAGPADDPAEVRASSSAAEAMAHIAQTGSTFVSRYDDSDLCVAESRLWSLAGVTIGNGRQWYKAARMEMVGSLRMADSLGAYILCEKEVFLQNRDSLSLVDLLDGAPDLLLQYCIIPVPEDESGRINAPGAEAFVAWLQSAEAQSLIASYGTDSYGCPIFELENMEESL